MSGLTSRRRRLGYYIELEDGVVKRHQHFPRAVLLNGFNGPGRCQEACLFSLLVVTNPVPSHISDAARLEGVGRPDPEASSISNSGYRTVLDSKPCCGARVLFLGSN